MQSHTMDNNDKDKVYHSMYGMVHFFCSEMKYMKHYVSIIKQI